MFGSSPFSYAPGGLSPEDLSPHRRSFHNDDQRASPVQRNSMTRPTGKSIYLQRKEYSETLNNQTDKLSVRVEHLFTCHMDGHDVNSISDCVAKLKQLDSKGHVWSQEMILELQGGYLVLSDIETKSELDSLPLSSIIETNAVLDTCAYNSLLTLTIQERSRHMPQTYMFQCEETGAEVIKADIDKAIQRGRQRVVEPRHHRPADHSEIRTNLENIIGSHVLGEYRLEGPRAVLRDRFTPSPELPQLNNRGPERYSPEAVYTEDLQMDTGSPLPSDTDRDTEIFNHVLSDLEIFMENVIAALNAASQKSEQKKKSKKKKASKAQPAVSLPSWDQYVACLQKIKYGFNLLGQLEGALSDPSAEDYVHIIFNILAMMVPHYPPDIPPTVLSPPLTDTALQLLGSVVSPEEEQLWGSMGDSWTIPRSQWPEEDIPPYIPEFYDGWQPPPPSRMSRNRPMSGSNNQQNGWSTPPPSPRGSEPEYMRAIYDFMARNNRELNLMNGEVVEVVQKNRQWWLVRNNRNEEGHVPQNVLKPMDRSQMGQRDGPVTLNMSSSSAEVSAWLSYKGFSKMTVKSLGVLNGRLLLGMTKDEMRAVCPEDGGKVFFQLQAIKSAIALASEPSGPYNGHY